MAATSTQRPRNVDVGRAAAILYGDWGTSKAYVIGLAFAVAGYSSFWLIAPMCLLTVLAVGLILRGLATERAQKKARGKIEGSAAIAEPSLASGQFAGPFSVAPEVASCQPLVCTVRGIGRTLDFAIDEAKDSGEPLYLLFVREQPVLAEGDHQRKWQDDVEAREIFSYAKNNLSGHPLLPCYAVSDSPAKTIVDIAATLGASRLILGVPRRSALLAFLRGNIIRQVSKTLPEEIQLLIYA